MSLLISPTEPKRLKELGSVSSAPEKCGVDVLWSAMDGLVGVQRKEVKDLMASINNRLLFEELAKARARLKAVWLLIEGDLFWDRDGRLAGELGDWYPRWTLTSYQNFLTGVQAEGVWVATTKDLTGTLEWVLSTKAWTEKEKHTSMAPTRRQPRGKWGTADNTEWMVHLLSAFEGLGVGRALALLKMYPNPLQWTVTEKELMKVPGIGKKLAQSLTRALAPVTVAEPPRPPDPVPNREGESGVGGGSAPLHPPPTETAISSASREGEWR